VTLASSRHVFDEAYSMQKGHIEPMLALVGLEYDIRKYVLKKV